MTIENDKSSLLDSLRIERGAPVRRRRGAPLWLYSALAVLVLVGGTAGWYFWPHNSATVHAVTATAVGSGGATGTGLDASGYIVARRTATVSAKILGKVTEVNFEEGQRVKAGEVVAKLDDSNYNAALQQAVQQETAAKQAYEDAVPIWTRYQRLKAEAAISTDAFENQRSAYDTVRTAYSVAKAATQVAQANENDTVVRAPFDGIVTNKVAQVGEIVAPSGAGAGDTRTGIVTIVDMNSLEGLIDVSENYIEQVDVGGEAVIHLEAYPDWDIPGSVIAIIPTADQSKGTVQVRVRIGTKDPRILPQMAARVTFMTAPQKGIATAASRVSVPPAAVLGAGKNGTVFLITNDGKLEKRDVALGLKTAQSITILSGVAAGDRLATDNLDKLHDGQKVEISN